MRERPLLASDAVPLNLRSGAQTQDRRPIRWPAAPPEAIQAAAARLHQHPRVTFTRPNGSDISFGPPWERGDLLYVRERTRVVDVRVDPRSRAEDHPLRVRLRYEADDRETGWLWMPKRLALPVVGRCLANGCHKEAARTWLRVVDVRPERLQAITEEDARAEGVGPPSYACEIGHHPHRGHCVHCDRPLSQHIGTVAVCPGSHGESFSRRTARGGFSWLWDQLYGIGSWQADGWVWRTVLELDRERSGLTEKAATRG